MTFAEVQVKWSVILIDRLGPDIFSTLRMKGHVLHRARAHLKVPGWSLVWNTLLTKKLPMFLSRLNEINGGCEKILPVSGSFWSNLKFFRMIDFTAWLWGWNMWGWMEFYRCCPFVTFVELTVHQFVGRDDGPLQQQKLDSHVCWRNCTFPLILMKNQSRVVTTKTTKSKELRIRNGILDMWWMWRWIQQITMRICGFVVHTSA